jgi:hypothetical protein
MSRHTRRSRRTPCSRVNTGHRPSPAQVVSEQAFISLRQNLSPRVSVAARTANFTVDSASKIARAVIFNLEKMSGRGLRVPDQRDLDLTSCNHNPEVVGSIQPPQPLLSLAPIKQLHQNFFANGLDKIRCRVQLAATQNRFRLCVPSACGTGCSLCRSTSRSPFFVSRPRNSRHGPQECLNDGESPLGVAQ